MVRRYLCSAILLVAAGCTQSEPLERSSTNDAKGNKKKKTSDECFNLVVEGHRTPLERTGDSLLVLGDIVLGRVNDSEEKDGYGLSNTVIEGFSGNI